jgi:hypothetical protein
MNKHFHIISRDGAKIPVRWYQLKIMWLVFAGHMRYMFSGKAEHCVMCKHTAAQLNELILSGERSRAGGGNSPTA